MAEVLSMISVIAFVLSGIGFLCAIVFWFWFKIPVVIGDLSGRTAKKSIARLRSDNEQKRKSEIMPKQEQSTMVETELLESGSLLEERNKTEPLVSSCLCLQEGSRTKQTMVLLEEMIEIHTEEVIE